MKLKNSYVLLIAMSIFLLISIGSVCASDNVTSDSDTQLASADAEVTLTDDGDATPDIPDSGEVTQEKINTTVTAQDQKIKEDEDKNISVTVNDNESKEIKNITKNNLTVTENNKNISFDYNNSVITIKDKLTVGEHDILISYLGNEKYNSSSILIKLKIYTNNTLEVPTVVDLATVGGNVEIPINLTDGIDSHTELITNENTNVTVNGQVASWSINGNTLTVNGVTAPANITINYTDESGASIIKKVQVKYKTIVIIVPAEKEINEGDNITFNVKVTDANGQQLNITKENLTITKTGATNKFNETTGDLTLSGLKKGIYNITITYKGNDVNNTSKATILIKVRGSNEINTNGTAINVNSTKKGEIQIINITNGVDTFDFTKGDLKINVTYKDGNSTKTIPVTNWNLVNGTIQFELENANFTTATLTITYNETTNKNITLNRIYNAKIIAVTTENEYKDGNFTFKLLDIDDNDAPIAGKSVTLYTTGNIRAGFSATTDKDGIASFKNANLYTFDQSSTSLAMNELKVGTYEVEIQSGSVKATSLKCNLTITQATINIVVDPFKEYYGTTKKVKITVTNAKSGQPLSGVILHLYMPQTSGKDYYFQTNSEGVSEIAVSGLVGGTYDLTVSNNDTKNIAKKEVKGTITIVPKPVKIAVSNLQVYYNTGSTATIKVTDKSTGKAVAGAIVTIQIDKGTKFRAQVDSKGTITFTASLKVGKHTIKVATDDTRYSGSTVSKTFTIKKASAKITAKKVTTYYKGTKYFNVKLTNTKNKKAIYLAKMNIKVYVSKTKYYNYNGQTGTNGQIKLSLASLKPGTYKVVVSGADSKSFTAKKVTTKIVVKKAPTKLTPKKLTAKKGAKKYFQVKVTNKKTKKVIKGVKVKIKVYTGKKAKTYTAKTNAKGIAKISTKKLKVGKHKVIVTSANKYCVAKKAKSTIKIKK